MKKIALLGATGSIGTSTLDVLAYHRKDFQLTSFSYFHNSKRAREIIQQFHPKVVCCGHEEDVELLCKEFPTIQFTHGVSGLEQIASLEEVDLVITALTGSVGLRPTLSAIEARKDIGLANKETLVMAGEFVMRAAKEKKVQILPIDSEHSAIFQCLQGQDQKAVRKITLTASGGSFRDKSRQELENVTAEQALQHPNWSMGKKITIDSSTMVNKGLEVIEAHFLFHLPYEKIEVLQHRESVIHSMVTFEDGATLAQLGASDMREAIMYAMTYPNRKKMGNEKPFDLAEVATLHFEKMDFERFPMLATAFFCGKQAGSFPAVYNAANEVAVTAFLEGKIKYLEIEHLIQKAVETHEEQPDLTLEKILAIDEETRRKVEGLIHLL